MGRTRKFLTVFALWTLCGVLGKAAFMAMYQSQMGTTSISDWFAVLWHGLRLDVAIAGYLTLLPGVLLVAAQWWRKRSWEWCWRAYFAVAASLYSLALVSNIGLYGYWGFPLDNTPLLYIRTSPGDALASLTTWQLIVAPLAVILVGWGMYKALARIPGTARNTGRNAGCNAGKRPSALETCCLLLLTLALILPIRGGISTGTNHTGSVYFSQDMTLNHAAVNPVFSFMESVSHQEEIGTKYRFMPDDEASRLFASLTCTALRSDTADVPPAVREVGERCSAGKTNVVLVMLEGFSSYIMSESGHVAGVTPCLDRLSLEGIYFTRFYANSFRTDRAIVSVLSGLPAQPTMSIMDMPRKSSSLPSIAKSLAGAGYSTAFYYGGDTDYSNMRSYLVGTGFQQVVSEDDFTKQQRTGKWGAPDGFVFQRVLEDLRHGDGSSPVFAAVMTASSHEPFDVPYQGSHKEPELNAFEYADSCLGAFVDGLRSLPMWQNTLVVIVPDHLGAYPFGAHNYDLWRYHLPLVIVGGAVREPLRVPTVGCQTDIAATLFALLGMEHREFLYSKDIFDPAAPHYAFFTFPDAMGFVDGDGCVIYDNAAAAVTVGSGKNTNALARKAKAFLQKLYDNIDSL